MKVPEASHASHARRGPLPRGRSIVVSVAHTAQLAPATLVAARGLMDEAFGDAFSDQD